MGAANQREYNTKTIIALIIREDYKDLRNLGIRILRRSRLFHWSNVLTNSILVLILRHIVSVQRKKKDANEEDKMFYKQAEILMKYIADSIAWRTIKYKRAQIRVMSENAPSGHLKDHEIPVIIKSVSESRDILIPNDITNYLRIGDLTQISSNGPVIWELKERKKRTRKWNILDILNISKKQGIKFLMSPQNIRHKIAQDAFIENAVLLPKFNDDKIRVQQLAEIRDLDFKIKHHHEKMKSLLKKSRTTGVIFARLEAGFYVEIINMHPFINSDKVRLPNPINFDKDVRTKYTDEKAKGHFIINLSNIDLMPLKGNRFPRIWTPFSILPFPARDCVDIGLGYIQIRWLINIDELIKRFNDEDWIAESVPASLEGKNSQSDGERLSDEVMRFKPEKAIIQLKKLHDDEKDYVTYIPLSQILTYISAFYKFDFFVDYANTMYKKFTSEPHLGMRTGMHNCTGEAKVLK